MPQNKRESLIYTVLMCFCMVLWMSMYNVTLHMGGFSLEVLKEGWLGFPIAYVFAMCCDWFLVSGLVFRNVEMRGVKAPFVINMFYFCDPDGHGPYVQCREALPVDEYTPKLGTLTMEDIVATDAQFAGCYFDGLPEQPIEQRNCADP